MQEQDAETAPVQAPWTPDVASELQQLVCSLGRANDRLEESIEDLARLHGDAVYTELIHLLSHLRFSGEEARGHWQSVVRQRQSMVEKLGEPVDILVALVSYFVQVRQELRNPVIIELALFEETRASAYHDELTGLANYRHFAEFLEREVQRGLRYNTPISLLMLDLDDFKRYNDRHGHEAGNNALASLAPLLRDALRTVDLAARYGGEEFVLVLPSTEKAAAQIVAERIREKVAGHSFPLPGNSRGHLTVSIGAATFPGDASSVKDLIQGADSALYVAKSHGKNRVHLFGEDRRSYRRIPARLDGTFCVLAAEYHPLTTINVSRGGLRFLLDRQVPVGTLIDLLLLVPGAGEEFAASGRIIRLAQRSDGRFEAAANFIDLSHGDRTLLARYLEATEGDAEGGENEDREAASVRL